MQLKRLMPIVASGLNFNPAKAPLAHDRRYRLSGFGMSVLSERIGPGGGFGKAADVLGAPAGAGGGSGALRVRSLGIGGSIDVEMGRNLTKTSKLKVFGNEFGINGKAGKAANPEPANVFVGDGTRWFKLVGIAGKTTVQANYATGIRPSDKAAGGTVFDLSKQSAVPADFKGSLVRVVDRSDLGNANPPVGGKAGFDLHALYVLP